MKQTINLARTVFAALQPWAARNVTFSLLLAVLTEVPRWTFAFRAVNEPLWAGIPLAILIAFAAAHAWEEYFAQHDWLLLALNVASLLFAVFTIAPVLYAMIDTQAHAVSIAKIFPVPLRWAWAVVLACTTFLPLIQLAVVEARRRERLHVERMVLRVVPQPPKQSPAQPEAKQIPEAPKPEAQPVAVDLSSLDLETKRQRAAAMVAEPGRTLDEVASMFGVNPSTVSRWVAKVKAEATA